MRVPPGCRRGVVGPLSLLWLAACGSPERATADSTASSVRSTAAGQPWFVDRAAASGLDFVHVNGMSGRLYIAEIMAPGVALLDYDNDGDLDVYAVQGQALDSHTTRAEAQDRLYRNDTTAPGGSPTLRFTDVTKDAGLAPRSYGMGAATGDFDNDGRVDIYLTRFGQDALLRNNGDGTFTDVFAAAALIDPGWSVAASFFDFNRDGWLDLYVSGYLRFDTRAHTPCVGPNGVVDYCHPQTYRAVPGRLFRNRRDGTFEDVTVASGITEYGPALGTLALDANADGWLDLYVANDGTENHLWLNRRDATFVDGALLAGVAVNGDGRPEGSMGVDAADYDNDGDDDLIVANLTGEGSTLYVNDGGAIFRDAAAAAGLRSRSLPYTGFGIAWLDVDNDGWLDLLTVNGAIQTLSTLAAAGDPFPLHQRKQLFRNRGDGTFEDATAAAGPVFELSEVGRGAAFGDVDNDGDVDVLVANSNGPLRLLVNDLGGSRRWLGVRAVTGAGRDALGARVGIGLKDGSWRWRQVRSDGSYASGNDPRVLFGLGSAGEAARVRVQWPDGSMEEAPVEGSNRWVTIRQGSRPPSRGSLDQTRAR
jgi:hypothetical protein